MDLYTIASSFRKAIITAINSGDIVEINLMGFPRGCCTYSSDLLQRYLYERGIDTLFMSGRYGYGRNGESHAWLETLNGTVIDITGDQYKNKKLKFTMPVYVGPRNDGFHDKFELDEPLAYEAKQDTKFEKRYSAVMRYMIEV